MTPKRKKRLMVILAIVCGVGIAVALAVNAFRQNMLYFFTPTQIKAGEQPDKRSFRLGGLVAKNSVERAKDSLLIRFDVTDTHETIKVEYSGILPDLFREGQGVVAIGQMGEKEVFKADEILAKHDENYMPPEVADALEQAHNKGVAEKAAMDVKSANQ